MLKRTGQFFLWVLIAGFVIGLGYFFQLRFSSGELYPEYSSFRADPFGTKAFFESLGRFDNMSVARQLQSVDRLKPAAKTTVFFLGAKDLPSSPGGIQHLENLAKSGARIFIALNAMNSRTAKREHGLISHTEPRNEKPPHIAPTIRFVPLKLIDPFKQEADRLEALRISESGGPAALTWYGRYCFEPTTNWETIYETKGKPVVILKKVGLGNIVLCADTFPFSNEALSRERSPEFLLWAVGAAGRIIFDETHLGVIRGSSIMIILREYHLHGLFFGLLVVAALWIWKSSSSLVPAYREASSKLEAVEGKTAREGVVHLLERNFAPEELPAVCLREWSRSHPNPNATEAARLKEAEAALAEYGACPKKERNPLEIYQRITNILSPAKR